MSGTVNGFAVNQSALATWVKAATVVAALGLAATPVEAVRVRFSTAALVGSATPSAACVLVKPVAATATARLMGAAHPYLAAAGATDLIGTARAAAYCQRLVYAHADAVATTSSYVVADAEIGEAAFTGTLTVEALATRNRPGRATLTAGATSTPSGATFGQVVACAASATARVEASVQRVVAASGAPYLPTDATAYLTLAGSEYHVYVSGGAFVRHDGYAETRATGTLIPQVSWWGRSVVMTGAMTLTAETQRTRPGTVSALLTGGSLVNWGLTLNGDVTATALGALAAVGSRDKTASAAISAVGTARLPVPPAIGYGGQATAQAAFSAVAPPLLQARGRAAVTGRSTAEVQATRAFPAQATATTRVTMDATLARSHLGLVYGYSHGAITAYSFTAHQGAAGAAAFLLGSALGGYVKGGTVAATAGATATEVVHATQHYASATGLPLVQGQAAAYRGLAATVSALATLTVAAVGTARGDYNAPPERSMVIRYEPRGMIVPEAERTLWVPA